MGEQHRPDEAALADVFDSKIGPARERRRRFSAARLGPAAGCYSSSGRRGQGSTPAHAVLAARGQWVTNDKTLLTRAGLREIDEVIAVTGHGRESLVEAVDRSVELCSLAMHDAGLR